LLTRLERGEGDAGTFDAVLIDEYQDFSLSWFKCAKLALKEPEDGDLLIVGDASQALYKLRGFTWSDAGIQWRGRSTVLKVNYRNTREMMIAAESFASSTDEVEGDPRAPVRPAAATCHRRGAHVEIVQAASLTDEIQRAAELANGWIATGCYRPHEIGILYDRQEDKAYKKALRDLRQRLSHHGTTLIAGQTADGTYADAGIKISTIRGSKGLQFPAVIFLWADLLPSKFDDRVEGVERGLMYVALTRAEQQLVVLHSEPSRYINELRGNVSMPEAEAILGQPWLPAIRENQEQSGVV
jgi:superfamily I DNA/RNA helicase